MTKTRIEYVKGDAIAIAKEKVLEGQVLLPHVTNNQGAWGSGFVCALSEEWPASLGAGTSPEAAYHRYAVDLGNTTRALAAYDLHVVNMTAQTLGGKRPLNYGALARCMASVALWGQEDHRDYHYIVAPKFGSARAGGDWTIIEELIDGLWCPEFDGVIIVEYDGSKHA